jgi:hypothetical protein
MGVQAARAGVLLLTARERARVGLSPAGICINNTRKVFA